MSCFIFSKGFEKASVVCYVLSVPLERESNILYVWAGGGGAPLSQRAHQQGNGRQHRGRCHAGGGGHIHGSHGTFRTRCASCDTPLCGHQFSHLLLAGAWRVLRGHHVRALPQGGCPLWFCHNNNFSITINHIYWLSMFKKASLECYWKRYNITNNHKSTESYWGMLSVQ